MSIYKDIVRRFPPSIVYSFAYGSGVKQQLGYEATPSRDKVIDLIFCVEDARKWHRENYEKHSSHYSALKTLGSRFIASYQENLGAKVYFNTLVPISDLGVTIKYGVVSKNDLLEDLTDWEYLYLAGRLHKPVTPVIAGDDVLNAALQQNLQSAFTTALLLLPENFSDFELFHKISSLSYKGDFRMIFGENKNKVRNIVEAQLDGFFELYHPTLRALAPYVALGTDRKGGRIFEQDKSIEAIERHMQKLPKNLQNSIVSNSSGHGRPYSEIVANTSNDQNLHKLIEMSVDDIVWQSSIWQSVKNIPSAGLLKSIVYSWRKAGKTFA